MHLDKTTKRPARTILKVYQENERDPRYRETQARTTCKKGCDHCCHLLLLSTLPEALVTAEKLLTDPTWQLKMQTLMRRLYEALTPLGDPFLSKESYFEKHIPCVFLEGGECSIYEARPAACRYHYVTSPPENCAVDAEDPTTTRLNLLALEVRVWEEGIRVLQQQGLAFAVAPFPVVLLWALKLLVEGPAAMEAAFHDPGLLNLEFWNRRMVRMAQAGE